MTLGSKLIVGAKQGQAFPALDIAASGGAPPYTYSLAAGTLPAGVTLGALNGKVSGAATARGRFSDIVLRTTDATSAVSDLDPFTVVVSAEVASIAPSAFYNGTPGSGFNGSPPTDPTRTTAKPWAVPMWVDGITIDRNTVIGADCGAGSLPGVLDGVSEVIFHFEGTSVSVTAEEFHHYVDVNGKPNWTFGHQIEVDYDAWLTSGVPLGRAHMYIEAVPNDPSMQNRVAGPFVIAAVAGHQAAPWGGPAIYDKVLELNPNSPASIGVRYPTVKAALEYLLANGFVRGLLHATVTANYPLDRVATPFNTATAFTTIAASPGVIMTLTHGAQAAADPRFDGLRFMGQNVVWDTALMSSTFGASYVCQSASTCSLWMDGITVTTSTPVGGTGAGANALKNGRPAQGFYLTVTTAPQTTITRWYMTDATVTNVSSFGVAQMKLVRGCTISHCGGSGMESLGGAAGALQRRDGCAHNCTIDSIGGYWADLRTYKDAFTLSYSGAAERVAFAKVGVNKAGGSFDGLQAFTASMSGNVITVTSLTTSTVLSVGQRIWLPGETAPQTITALGTGTGGTGTYTVSGPGKTIASNANFWATMVSSAIVSGVSNSTLIPALVSDMQANWPGWAVTNLDTSGRAAMYLSTTSIAPSAAIPPTDTTGATATLKSILDEHSDCVVLGASSTIENVGFRFITAKNIVQSASLSWGAGATLISVGYRNCSFQDVSTTAPAPNNTPQPTYLQSSIRGVVWKWLTLHGAPGAFGKGGGSGTPAFNADAYCRISYSAIEGLGYGTTVVPRPDPNQQIQYSSVRMGNATTLTDLGATNCITQNNAPATSLFVDPANNDLTPLAPLTLSDGNVAGRYRFDGSENGT